MLAARVQHTILAVLLFANSSLASAQDKPFIINHNNPLSTWNVQIYKTLFARLNIPVKLVSLPLKRASLSANSGEIDGQFGRIFEYQDAHPNQVRINVPLYSITMTAYAQKAAAIQLTGGWHSLQNNLYRIECQRGIALCENNVAQSISPTRYTLANTVKQGLVKLLFDRTDIFINSDLAVQPFFMDNEYYRAIEPVAVMEKVMLYPYLHKKHLLLVPQFERVLKTMRQEGLFEKACLEEFGPNGKHLCTMVLSNS